MKPVLYQIDVCPYCQKVRRAADKLGIDIDVIDVPRDREAPLRQEIKNKSGVPTVPVMQFGDRYIGESDAIVAELESMAR
ncbi:hypothetical protein RCL1_008368 [Eukaryota sp. TZLM3-RCL]